MEPETERAYGKIKVVIDRDLCIGSGNCVRVAPEVFELDAEAVTTFVRERADVTEDLIVEACDVCPVSALKVVR